MFEQGKMKLVVEFLDGSNWPILIKNTCPIRTINT